MAVSLSLEKQQYLIELVPCLCQIKPNDKFSQCAVGITEKEILIYSDMEPSRNTGDVFYYNTFATIELKEVVNLVKSEMKNNEELKKYIRLDIFHKDLNKCRILYFLKTNKAKLTRFIAAAKKAKVKTINHVVDYQLKTY